MQWVSGTIAENLVALTVAENRSNGELTNRAVHAAWRLRGMITPFSHPAYANRGVAKFLVFLKPKPKTKELL
jgi:hypothetical protein